MPYQWWTDLTSGIRVGHDPGDKQSVSFLAAFMDAIRERKEKREQWCAELRQKGHDGARVFDAWVDWKNDTLTMMCPDYCYNLKPGDLVAIGDPEKWWTARLIEKIDNPSTYDEEPDTWTFEWVGSFQKGGTNQNEKRTQKTLPGI